MSEDSATVTKATIEGKKKRVQLKHVLIDVDFFDKPKIRALAFSYPVNGVSILLHLYAMMSRATDGVIHGDAILALTKQWDIKDGKEFITYCVQHGLIHNSGYGYSNSRVERDQERCAEEREKAQERRRKYEERTRSERVPNDYQTILPVTDPVPGSDPDHIDPKKAVPPGAVIFGDPPKLLFDPLDWADLVMNWFNGNEGDCRDSCEAAADYLAQEGRPQPRDCLAYMRGWIRKSKQFAKGRSDYHKQEADDEWWVKKMEHIAKL